MTTKNSRRNLNDYKRLSFFERFKRVSQRNRIILSLLLGTYGILGLYSYETLDDTKPRGNERIIVGSFMPMQTEQQKIMEEEEDIRLGIAKEDKSIIV